MEEFRVLYENNYKKVCFYLKSMCRDEKLAEDLAQETFYNVLTLICSGKKLDVNRKWFIKVLLESIGLKGWVDFGESTLNIKIFVSELIIISGFITGSLFRNDLFAKSGRMLCLIITIIFGISLVFFSFTMASFAR